MFSALGIPIVNIPYLCSIFLAYEETLEYPAFNAPIIPFEIFFLKRVKISSRSGQKDQGQIRRFEVLALAPGDQDYRFSALKLRRNVLICMVRLRYAMIIDRILRKGQGHRQVTKNHYMLTM